MGGTINKSLFSEPRREIKIMIKSTHKDSKTSQTINMNEKSLTLENTSNCSKSIVVITKEGITVQVQ